MSDIRSVPGGCSRFSRCCYLRIDLSSHLFGESRAPGLSRSHLDSAVELGSSYPILSHRAYPFPVLIFFIAGLLSLALRARRPLGAYRIPSRPAFSSHLCNGGYRQEAPELGDSLRHRIEDNLVFLEDPRLLRIFVNDVKRFALLPTLTTTVTFAESFTL